MGRLFAVVLTLLVVACGGLPDPRHGTVVSDPELKDTALVAAAFWSEATGGDVSFRVADHCESGESCARVSAVDGPTTEWTGSSVQKPGSSEPGWVTVHVARWTLADPAIARLVLAHELGHFLFLGHVDDESDLMDPNPGPCLTPAALARYNDEWGTSLSRSTCLRDQNEIHGE